MGGAPEQELDTADAARHGAAVETSALDAFFREITAVPFGSLSKPETEFLVFRLLVEAGRLDEASDDFVVANELQTTAAKVRNLRFRLDQQAVRAGARSIAEVLASSGFVVESVPGSGPSRVRVLVGRTFVRDYLVSELARRKAIAATTLTRGVLEVDVFAFFAVVFDAFAVDGAPAEIRDRFEVLWTDISATYGAATQRSRRAAVERVVTDLLPKGVSSTAAAVTIVRTVADALFAR